MSSCLRQICKIYITQVLVFFVSSPSYSNQTKSFPCFVYVLCFYVLVAILTKQNFTSFVVVSVFALFTLHEMTGIRNYSVHTCSFRLHARLHVSFLFVSAKYIIRLNSVWKRLLMYCPDLVNWKAKQNTMQLLIFSS